MDIERKYTYNLKAEKSKKNPYYYIRIRVSYGGGNHLDVNTHCSVMDELAWDVVNHKVRKGFLSRKGAEYQEQNQRIAHAVRIIDDTFKYFEVVGSVPTPAELRGEYERRMKEHVDSFSSRPLKTFWEAFDEYTTVYAQENSWSKNTSIQFEVLRNILMGYRRRIAFEDLTEEWLTEFLIYLRDEKETVPHKAKLDKNGDSPEVKVGLKNSTIKKKLGFLKMFLNWATRKGYNKNMAFRTFNPKLKTVQDKVVIYLTEDERQKLRSCVLPPQKQYLERIRDIFLFCCFSGLRYSDVRNLKKVDIKNDKISITSIKDAQHLEIDLNNTTRAILQKYEDIPLDGGAALPVISNQKMNDMLQELCRLAGIDEPVTIVTFKGSERIVTTKPKYQWVTSHAGRRTFIVMCLSAGIPVTTVMKWTGHSSYAAMKPYIDIAKQSMEQSMRKLDNLI